MRFEAFCGSSKSFLVIPPSMCVHATGPLTFWCKLPAFGGQGGVQVGPHLGHKPNSLEVPDPPPVVARSCFPSPNRPTLLPHAFQRELQ